LRLLGRHYPQLASGLPVLHQQPDNYAGNALRYVAAIALPEIFGKPIYALPVLKRCDGHIGGVHFFQG